MVPKSVRNVIRKVPSPYILWLGWIMWLPFLIPGTIDLFKANPPPLLLWLTVAAEIAYAGVYSRAARLNARNLSRMPVE